MLRGTSVNNVSLYDFSLLPVEIQIGIPLVQYFRNYDLRAELSNGKHENEIVEFGEKGGLMVYGDQLQCESGVLKMGDQDLQLFILFYQLNETQEEKHVQIISQQCFNVLAQLLKIG